MFDHISELREEKRVENTTRSGVFYDEFHVETWGNVVKHCLKDVRANCSCASLLRTKFTSHVMHRARALSS